MHNQVQILGVESFGPVRQLGHVVDNIDAWMADISREQGIGPWLVMRNVQLKCHYLGEPSRPVIDVALSYRGDLQIELIQQRNNAPSPYLDAIREGHYGLHHKAHLCADIDADVIRAQARGWQMVCDIRMFGSRYVYLQRPDGGYVELLPASWMMRMMFRRGIAAARRWQGAGSPTVIDMKTVGTLIRDLPGLLVPRGMK